MKTFEIVLGVISPEAVPALRIAGALFIIINLLAGAWVWRRRRQLFGPDGRADGDRQATRLLQVVVIVIPWFSLTVRLVSEWVKLWIS
jgi:hypothetical protein